MYVKTTTHTHNHRLLHARDPGCQILCVDTSACEGEDGRGDEEMVAVQVCK